MSGHQAIEDDAERVDVAGGCDLLAAHLLGAGKFGSHGPRVGGVGVDCLEVEFGIEQLGDAEIEQLGLAFRGDKNVCRLQVAMDDQLLMSVFNRGADLKKELEPIFIWRDCADRNTRQSAGRRRTPSQGRAGRLPLRRHREDERCEDDRGLRESAFRL